MLRICVPSMDGADADVSSGYVGFSRHFLQFKKAFEELGIEVTTKDTNGLVMFVGSYLAIDSLKEYTDKPFMLFTAWETEQIGEQYINQLNDSTVALIVPNEWNKEVFIKNGYKNPIYVANLGIHEDFKKPKKRQYNTGEEFRVFHYNAGEPRKGWASFFHAFWEEFKDEPNVKLVLKNSMLHQKNLNKSISNLSSELQERVELHRVQYEIEDLVELAHSCHLFVFPSLGEGYGLPPREMLATGMPTIVTDGHSFTDLPNSQYIKIPVEYKQGCYAFRSDWAPVSGLAYIGSNHYMNQYLAYPKIDVLRKKMREVFENYEYYAEEAYQASFDVCEQETTLQEAKKLLPNLKKHYEY